MSRGHARTSEGLGSRDPRHRRGQGQGFNESVQLGEGLETDREGRVRVRFDERNEMGTYFLRADYRWANPRVHPYVHVTADYTADILDEVILCDASGGQITVTLPPAREAEGMFFWIKKVDSPGNNVVIDGFESETIDGATTQTMTGQYAELGIFSDGTEWWEIAAV